MNLYEIRTSEDASVHWICREITEFNEEIDKLGEILTIFVQENKGCVGVAAPQLGVVKRMFAWKQPSVNRIEVVVNPRIVYSGKEISADVEGCLSVPRAGYAVMRPTQIEVWFADVKGKMHTRRLSGYDARVFQHEMDHLDGVLISDSGMRVN
jgi:peptide deformylase